jgi:hypothetical protein
VDWQRLLHSPALDFLRAYGCPAYPLELGPGKQKWDARARPGKLVGFDADGQLYRVLLADRRTVKVTKHVRFQERAAGSVQPPDPVVTTRTSAARSGFYLCDDIGCVFSPISPAAGVNPSCPAPDVPALPVVLTQHAPDGVMPLAELPTLDQPAPVTNGVVPDALP